MAKLTISASFVGASGSKVSGINETFLLKNGTICLNKQDYCAVFWRECNYFFQYRCMSLLVKLLSIPFDRILPAAATLLTLQQQ
uniref:Uncharacterized protein n=1 Tax=Varanus komodoensis TaxID=61221 RepID=A0A8D2LQC2_VARKO